MTTSPSPPQGDTAKCHLLDAPPEIRNTIYELTFAPDTAQTVDLLDATPPSKALALTCHQIHGEAKLLYTEAYRKFWRETEFAITIHASNDGDEETSAERLNSELCSPASRLRLMNENDVENICHLRIGFGAREWNLDEQLWLEMRSGKRGFWGLLPRTYVPSLKDCGHRNWLPTCSTLLVAVVLNHGDGTIPSLDPLKKLVKGRKITIHEIIGVLEEAGGISTDRL